MKKIFLLFLLLAFYFLLAKSAKAESCEVSITPEIGTISETTFTITGKQKCGFLEFCSKNVVLGVRTEQTARRSSYTPSQPITTWHVPVQNGSFGDTQKFSNINQGNYQIVVYTYQGANLQSRCESNGFLLKHDEATLVPTGCSPDGYDTHNSTDPTKWTCIDPNCELQGTGAGRGVPQNYKCVPKIVEKKPLVDEKTAKASEPLKCDTAAGTNTGINTALGCIPIRDTNQFVAWFLRWALGIAGGVAFVLILIAGFQITTASGNPEKVQGGKELLNAAISGLILVIFSLFLLRLIGIQILQLPGLR